MSKFNARAFERELVDAGYMPLNEYIRRWGDDAEQRVLINAAMQVLPHGQANKAIDGVMNEALSSRVAREAARSIGGFVISLPFGTSPDVTKPKVNTRQRADD